MKKISLYTILLITYFQSINTVLSQETIYGAMGEDVMIPNWPIAECGGTTENLHSYLDEGKVVFVYYADTWCGPCKDFARRDLSSSILKGLLAKYPNKIQFLAAFDGPTDCNGVRNAKNEYGWGSEIKAFVDNTNQSSKFYTWGVPGWSIIDPKTKKPVVAAYHSIQPIQQLELLLTGKFEYPNAVSNIAYRKNITSLFPDKENKYQPLKCVNDGIIGSTYLPNGGPSAFIIDLGGKAEVTGFKSNFQEGGAGAKAAYTVSLSDNENGPWSKIAGKFGKDGVEQISNISYLGRYIKWESPSTEWFTEFSVQGKMLAPAGSENDEALESLTISPNPSNGSFNINLGNKKLENAKIIISDVSSKQLATLNLMSENNSIDLSYLENGVYIGKVYIGNSFAKTIKLVLQK